MVRKIETNYLESYDNCVELYELNGEVPGFEYGAKGEVKSREVASRVSRLSQVHLEPGDETKTGFEVQVFFNEKYWGKMGRELS